MWSRFVPRGPSWNPLAGAAGQSPQEFFNAERSSRRIDRSGDADDRSVRTHAAAELRDDVLMRQRVETGKRTVARQSPRDLEAPLTQLGHDLLARLVFVSADRLADACLSRFELIRW